MSTAYTYTVNFVEDGQPTAHKLAQEEFRTRAEAQAYIDARQQTLDELGWDAAIVEHPYDARFHVVAPSTPENALGLGAFVVPGEDYDGVRVVQICADHSRWLGGRLASGLWLRTSRPGYDGWETLDDARLDAQRWAAFEREQRERRTAP